MQANNTSAPRLGVVVGKRKQKKAVDRNKTKRVVRESFRCHQHTLQGFDIVVVAKLGIGKLNAEQLRQELSFTWGKLKQC